MSWDPHNIVETIHHREPWLYAYNVVGRARWAHLRTSHHIKPEPLGEDLMWCQVLRSAHLAVHNNAVCIFSYEYLFKAGISSFQQWSILECDMGWSHHIPVLLISDMHVRNKKFWPNAHDQKYDGITTRYTTSSEWKLFRFDKMEVNCFQILLIDVTFYYLTCLKGGT